MQEKLKQIEDRLSASFETSMRGGERCALVFATANGKAVEVSEHQDGGFWMEFWEASDNEDAAPRRELLVSDVHEVIRETTRWLSQS